MEERDRERERERSFLYKIQMFILYFSFFLEGGLKSLTSFSRLKPSAISGCVLNR
jgi:hypothetical protein